MPKPDSNGGGFEDAADRTLTELADGLVASVRRLLQHAKVEEELRIGFEKLLEPVLAAIGVKVHPRYERKSPGGKTVYQGRPDAVHGLVVIEYEKPKSLASKAKVSECYGQLEEYLTDEVAAQGEPVQLKPVGVGFDGETIFFVRLVSDESTTRRKHARKPTLIGPLPFSVDSARTLLTYLRGLARLPLTADNLAEKFGPASAIAPASVGSLVDALQNWGSKRVDTYFKEWKRLFGIVYGTQFSAQGLKQVRSLQKTYGVPESTDFQVLLFCVHTYFALLMKLIAAEIVTLKDTNFGTSFTSSLTHLSNDDLKAFMEEIEDGGVYAKKGITNFLEGDFFRWYLNALSPSVEDSIREIARGITEFEPATTSINPETTRDLLKRLYQYLVPKEVRQKLGEYYTPDWLAELVLDEVGYKGNPNKTFLDSACGSGTFLVLAIQRARAAHEKTGFSPVESIKKILTQISGFDLNPLAVIAARTNYLFALGDHIDELSSVEIPVYLADSVLWPEKRGQMSIGPRGESYKIPTSKQVFFVPKIWVSDKGFLMREAAPLVEELAKSQCSVVDAMEEFKKEGLVYPPHEEIVEGFYDDVLQLERNDENGIWARFLKNSFAPLVCGKFDFVVGNPPWIRWGYLSKEYREATLSIWKDYGLFSLKGHAARLGGGEKDFSMLFTYAAADYYVKDGGKLGFLITQEVFKSKGAGEGFRAFRINDNTPLKVLKAHDLVQVKPFEGAANKTAAIFLVKGKETKPPVPYYLWTRKKGIGSVPTYLRIDDAVKLLRKERLDATPIAGTTSSWRTVSKKALRTAIPSGRNAYKARRGASTEPYGVFWLELKQVLADGKLLVSNLPEKGKKDIRKIQKKIDQDLVYPSICGADIERWCVLPQFYVLVTQDPKLRVGYSEKVMRSKWRRTLDYVTNFKGILLKRAAYIKYHAEQGAPFYSQYNVAEYTFSRYKVVWKRMASDLVAAVISQHKTPFGYKSLIPTDTTAFFPVDNEAEAHYLCAIVNSTPVREHIKSYSSAGRGFGAPSVMEHVPIPKYDEKNKVHKELSQLSKKLHEATARKTTSEISHLEKQVDETVRVLFKEA